MEKDTKSRKWLLTINNPESHGYTHDVLKDTLALFKGLTYWCMCDEVGKEKTYHTHLFLFAKNPIRFGTLKKRFSTAHIDFVKGTIKENRDYIRKEGKHTNSLKAETNLKDTFEESGEMPEEQQGKRNDLHMLYDMIKDGYTDYEILEENANYILDMDKVERCRQIVRQEEFKNRFRELEVVYQFGATNKGKTRSVMEQYGYSNVYRVTDYLHPFDSYKGQDIIIFEEFRSSLKIQDMLNYLDGYPLDLPCRYNNKTACFTKVYIITNIALEKQYKDVQREYPETWNAFLRRIDCVKEFGENGITHYETMTDYLNRHLQFKKLTLEEQKEVDNIYKQEMLDLKKGK